MSYFNFSDDFFGGSTNEVERRKPNIPTLVDEIRPFVLDELKHHEDTCISFTIEKDSLRHDFTLQKTKKGIILTKLNKPLKNFTLNLSYYDLPDDINMRLNTYINDLKYFV